MKQEEIEVIKVKPEYIPIRCPVCNGHRTLGYGKIPCSACNELGFLKVPAVKADEEENEDERHTD